MSYYDIGIKNFCKACGLPIQDSLSFCQWCWALLKDDDKKEDEDYHHDVIEDIPRSYTVIPGNAKW